jgi:uncharacterized membrane protein YuzA (DUF378 family)
MATVRENDWGLSVLDWISVIIMIIGGLNWGCVGLFNFNVLTAIFGDGDFTRFLYVIVGLAALWSIIGLSAHVHQHTIVKQEPGTFAH